MNLSFHKQMTTRQKNDFFREKVNVLAKANRVSINAVCEEELFDLYYQFGRPSADGIFICNGSICYDRNKDEGSDVNQELVFHELLHILSVPPEYRVLMNHDTEKSYKNIRAVYNDTQKLCRESAVLGAQFLLYEDMNCEGYLSGSFFSGYIRSINAYGDAKTDIHREWTARGRKLLNSIRVPDIL